MIEKKLQNDRMKKSMANLREEKRLWKKGYKFVVGLDEAGRGALCGPVVAAAVLINSRIYTNMSTNITNKYSRKFVSKFVSIRDVRDSKKLSPKKREGIYKILTSHPQIEWAVGRVSEKVIDRINILEATKLAMEKAVRNLEKKLQNSSNKKLSETKLFLKEKKASKASKMKVKITHDRRFTRFLDFLVLDGNFKINSKIPQKSIIKADEKVFSCTCASIIAKVRRDVIMKKEHQKYPQYGFDKHKGYPTKFHKEQLKKHGLSVIHRKTFAPCKNLLK